MESFVPVARPWVYRIYLAACRRQIRSVQRAVPVIVGEWCLCNKYAAGPDGPGAKGKTEEREQREKFRRIAAMELQAWQETAGWFYWNYQLLRDRKAPVDQTWKESRGFMPLPGTRLDDAK